MYKYKYIYIYIQTYKGKQLRTPPFSTLFHLFRLFRSDSFCFNSTHTFITFLLFCIICPCLLPHSFSVFSLFSLFSFFPCFLIFLIITKNMKAYRASPLACGTVMASRLKQNTFCTRGEAGDLPTGPM